MDHQNHIRRPIERAFNFLVFWQKNSILDTFSNKDCDYYTSLILRTLLPDTGFLYRANRIPQGIAVWNALVTNVVKNSSLTIDLHLSTDQFYTATLYFNGGSDGVGLGVDETVLGWQSCHGLGYTGHPRRDQWGHMSGGDVATMYRFDEQCVERAERRREEGSLRRGLNKMSLEEKQYEYEKSMCTWIEAWRDEVSKETVAAGGTFSNGSNTGVEEHTTD